MSFSHRRILSRPTQPLHWAAVVILGFAVAAAALAWLGYRSQIDAVTNDALLRARGAAADVDRYVQSQWWTLDTVAQSPQVQSGDVGQMRTYFAALKPETVGLDAGIGWIDADGFLQARTGYAGPPIDFSNRDHIRRALESGRPTVSSAFVGTVNDAPIVAFDVPTFDAAGHLTGLVGSGIRLGELSIGADSLRYAGGTNVIIVDARGQVISNGVSGVERLETVDPRLPVDAMRAQGQGAQRLDVGPFAEPDQLIGYAVSPNSGWLVLVERSAEEAFAPAKNGFLAQLLGLFAGAALSIAILIWAARRLDSAVQEQSAAYETERATREELQRAVASLEEREGLRDAFVGVMSHELRTPVTTIYGAAKLLAKGPARDDAESLIADIEEESDRLRRITEDLLVLSRAQHGAVEVHPEPVLVQRLASTVVSDILRRFPDARVTLDLAADLPPVSSDPGALRQVLNNLLTNAVKYGDGAPIRIRAEDRDATSVQVCVEDLGPGVPAGELAHLFELFYRSPHNARKAAGTGIGLYVVRQLVEAMGGRVHGYALEPHGVGFAMTLPVYASDDQPEPLERPSGPGPVGALVGDR